MRRPFALLDQVPPLLRAVLLAVEWDRDRLQALDLPVVRLPVAALRWQLALPWWKHDGRVFAVSPEDVRRDPRTHQRHWARAMAASLAIPIDVRDADGWPILDGVHRLLKADLLGHPTLAARVVRDEDVPEVAAEGSRRTGS